MKVAIMVIMMGLASSKASATEKPEPLEKGGREWCRNQKSRYGALAGLTVAGMITMAASMKQAEVLTTTGPAPNSTTAIGGLFFGAATATALAGSGTAYYGLRYKAKRCNESHLHPETSTHTSAPTPRPRGNVLITPAGFTVTF